MAALFDKMRQLATMALDEEHHAPPPLLRLVSPELRVAPACRANPTSEAPLVSHAQRTAELPFVAPIPRITVANGPLTLCTVNALFNATRFVKSPAITRPPPA